MTVTSEEIQARVAGQTIPSEFLKTVRAHGTTTALRWRNEDETWGEWTYADYADRVARAAAGLRELGVRPGQRVVLMMRNIPEFHVVDMAAAFCGATPVSIYNSSSPEQVEYLVNHCDAVLGLVEDSGFLERFLKVRSDLKTVQHLGILRDPDGLAGPDVFTYDSLLAHEPIDLEAGAALCTPDQIATMIYTSGTTGPPKGVMLTHNNIAWTVEALKSTIQYDDFVGKRLVSYLPMAHIAERMTSHYQGAFVGYELSLIHI